MTYVSEKRRPRLSPRTERMPVEPDIEADRWQSFERTVDAVLSWRPAHSKKQRRMASRAGKSSTVEAKSRSHEPPRKQSAKSGRTKGPPTPLRPPREARGEPIAQSKPAKPRREGAVK